ncbi:MAG: 3-dehydroquinate synthase [Nitriliruptoraceae bacterium]
MTALTRIAVGLSTRSYDVVVGDSWINDLCRHVDVGTPGRRILLVTQQAVVDAGHAETVSTALRAAGMTVHRHLVPDGEVAKSPTILFDLWRAAAGIPLSRSDLVVAVGGGVVGDLAGFLAATYNRGVEVVQVPTTLLAQVDAAIGGKTGINLPEGKNLVGAFHQPVAVACDVATLSTLPKRILIEGLGEVVKCGLIADATILDDLESAPDHAREGDTAMLAGLVARSVAVKARIVSADERETGRRAWLNFGHTWAHVIEAATKYDEVLHGEAVAMGMMVALRLGERLGRTPAELVARTEQVLHRLGLPTAPPTIDRDVAWQLLRRDKKAVGDEVRFVILDGLALPTLITPDPAEVASVLVGLGAID